MLLFLVIKVIKEGRYFYYFNNQSVSFWKRFG